MIEELWEDEVALKLERFIEDKLAKTVSVAALGLMGEGGDVPAAAWDAAVAQVRYFFAWHGFETDNL